MDGKPTNSLGCVENMRKCARFFRKLANIDTKRSPKTITFSGGKKSLQTHPLPLRNTEIITRLRKELLQRFMLPIEIGRSQQFRIQIHQML